MKVFIEQPGEKNTKNVFEKETGKFLKTVSIPMTYPYPYGYILDTLAADGENLDCYIITDKKLEAEGVVECEPLGMVEWFEDGEEDHKVLAVLKGESQEITPEVQSKITDFALHFFDDQPNKRYRMGEFYGKEKSVELIQRSTDPKPNF